MKCLNDIKIGERARVVSVNCNEIVKQRFLSIGLVRGTCVECVGKSPGGDPRAYLIRGAVIAVRSEDGGCVEICEV